jgi:hypothetical protein
MSPLQYWVVCVDEGMLGFAYANCIEEAKEIAVRILLVLEVPSQPVFIYPIGPRLFAKETIETGEC